ncbi:MAG: hypothetical protein VB092_02580, partial [Oscillospiraceae bacterium]|nr:hypothetical protein [Oscillospiraceae bacterium]
DIQRIEQREIFISGKKSDKAEGSGDDVAQYIQLEFIPLLCKRGKERPDDQHWDHGQHTDDPGKILVPKVVSGEIDADILAEICQPADEHGKIENQQVLVSPDVFEHLLYRDLFFRAYDPTFLPFEA